MNAEIREWANRYEALKEQKTMIEKESSILLKNMENNHMKAVKELEDLYEKVKKNLKNFLETCF